MTAASFGFSFSSSSTFFEGVRVEEEDEPRSVCSPQAA
jgi:hypothetical protein